MNIGSGDGLVPLGNKPLPEPMLMRYYVSIWPQQGPVSYTAYPVIDAHGFAMLCFVLVAL